MKIKKLSNKILVMAVIFCVLAIPLIAGAAVSDTLKKKPPLGKAVSQEIKTEMINKTLVGKAYLELKKKYNFDDSKITVKQLEKEYGEVYAVTIPIKDNTGHNYSNYTEFFSKEKKYNEEYLLVFNEKDANGIYHSIIQTKGSYSELNVDEKGKVISNKMNSIGLRHDLNSIIGITTQDNITPKPADSSFVSCVNDCLSSQGVAAWLITMFTATCGVLCEGGPVACSTCGVFAIYGCAGQFGYCLGYCAGSE